MNRVCRSNNSIRISALSILINVLLAAFKFLAGSIGHSQALIADAAHSLSDFLSTVIVIAALLVSKKAPDKDHEYGHQRYESLASLFLALLLAFVGVKIGVNGLKSIETGMYRISSIPTFLSVSAAAVSIAAKEIMFHCTMKVAKQEKSNALKADAWHHRSDALSSVGSMAGVILAKIGFSIMDPVAGIIICFFILFTAIKIFLDAVKALTDASGGQELEDKIRVAVFDVDGVICIDELKTRQFGSGYYADIEIVVDGSKTLEEAHGIAEKVHENVEQQFNEIWHCMVHVNPSL